ncbi:MAG: hypothetical protein ABSC76_07035 [Terracidiphilus sp.]
MNHQYEEKRKDIPEKCVLRAHIENEWKARAIQEEEDGLLGVAGIIDHVDDLVEKPGSQQTTDDPNEIIALEKIDVEQISQHERAVQQRRSIRPLEVQVGHPAL